MPPFVPGMAVDVCVGCGAKFHRGIGAAGQFCSWECYRTPKHLRRKRRLGTLTKAERAFLAARKKD